MRPRLLSRGKHMVAERPAGGRRASMRPRLLSRGKFQGGRRAVGGGESFNEAATVNSRKECSPRSRFARTPAASMRPRLLSRGKDVTPQTTPERTDASMRPRLLSRGKSTSGRSTRRVALGFNEAATVKSRKDLARRAYATVHTPASMRPRLLSRGKGARTAS